MHRKAEPAWSAAARAQHETKSRGLGSAAAHRPADQVDQVPEHALVFSGEGCLEPRFLAATLPKPVQSRDRCSSTLSHDAAPTSFGRRDLDHPPVTALRAKCGICRSRGVIAKSAMRAPDAALRCRRRGGPSLDAQPAALTARLGRSDTAGLPVRRWPAENKTTLRACPGTSRLGVPAERTQHTAAAVQVARRQARGEAGSPLGHPAGRRRVEQ